MQAENHDWYGWLAFDVLVLLPYWLLYGNLGTSMEVAWFTYPTCYIVYGHMCSCLQKPACEQWSAILCSHQFYPYHYKFLWEVKVICHFTSHPRSFTAQTSPLMSRWKRYPSFYWFWVKKSAAWNKFHTQQGSLYYEWKRRSVGAPSRDMPSLSLFQTNSPSNSHFPCM